MHGTSQSLLCLTTIKIGSLCCIGVSGKGVYSTFHWVILTIARLLNSSLCCVVTLSFAASQSQELIIQKKFSEAEVAALEFLHILETYYSIQSYDQAHELNSKATSRFQLFYVQSCIYVYMCVCMYVYLSIYLSMHVCMCVCMYVCM